MQPEVPIWIFLYLTKKKNWTSKVKDTKFVITNSETVHVKGSSWAVWTQYYYFC